MPGLIRAAQIQDLPALAELFQAHLDEQATFDPLFRQVRNPAFDSHLFITRSWAAGIQQFLVAEDASRRVGFSRFSIWPESLARERFPRRGLPARPGQKFLRFLASRLSRLAGREDELGQLTRPQPTGYLADLYVLPDCRRQGFGRLLVEATFQWFAEQKIDTVYLQVSDGNQVGIEFWKRMGFQPYRHTLLSQLR